MNSDQHKNGYMHLMMQAIKHRVDSGARETYKNIRRLSQHGLLMGFAGRIQTINVSRETNKTACKTTNVSRETRRELHA